MSVHVTIQLSVPSFRWFSSSCQIPKGHFIPCSCFSCAQVRFISLSQGFESNFLLDGQIISKTCIPMFIHLPLSLMYLIKHFPSLRSPKFLIFAQTLVSCYNLAIFQARPVFCPFGPLPLTQSLKLNFPLLPNIPPYFPKFSQEFRSPLSPSFRFISTKFLVSHIGISFTQKRFQSNKRLNLGN